jgi:hypothetical protein
MATRISESRLTQPWLQQDNEVRDRGGAIANTRAACAPQIYFIRSKVQERDQSFTGGIRCEAQEK